MKTPSLLALFGGLWGLSCAFFPPVLRGWWVALWVLILLFYVLRRFGKRDKSAVVNEIQAIQGHYVLLRAMETARDMDPEELVEFSWRATRALKDLREIDSHGSFQILKEFGDDKWGPTHITGAPK